MHTHILIDNYPASPLFNKRETKELKDFTVAISEPEDLPLPLPRRSTIKTPSIRAHCKTPAETALWFIPLVYVATELSYTIKGVTNMEDSTLSGKTLSAAEIIIPFIDFLQSVLVNGKWTVRGIHQTYDYFKHQKIPEDWPDLSQKNKLLTGMTVVISAGSAGFSGIAAFHYFKELTGSKTLGIVDSVCEAPIFFLCEGPETIKALLTTELQNYYHPRLTRALSYPTTLLSLPFEIAEILMPTTQVFSLSSYVEKILAGTAITITNGATSFCYYGELYFYAIDEITRELSEIKSLNQAIYFTRDRLLTLFPAFLLGLAQIYFGFEVIAEINTCTTFLTLSLYNKVIRDVTILAQTLYEDEDLHAAIDYLRNKLSCSQEKKFLAQEAPDEIKYDDIKIKKDEEKISHNEKKSERHYQNGNKSLMFTKTSIPDATPRRSVCDSISRWFCWR